MKTKSIATIILVLAAAAWTGCTQENPVVPGEQVPEEQHTTVQFTATLEGKGGEATKALSSDGTATWAVDEEIAVYYQKSDDTYDTATATVTSVTDGKATIKATLSDAKDGGSATLVYPASLHNGTGGIDKDQILGSQYGTISGDKGISKFYDAAIGDCTISVEGNNAFVNGKVEMHNQLCICKFILNYIYEQESSTITQIGDALSKVFYVTCGDAQYAITSAYADESSSSGGSIGGSVSTGGGTTTTRGFKRGDEIYVAMFPYVGTITCTLPNKTFSPTRQYTTTTKSAVTLKSGQFYTNMSLNLIAGTPQTSAGISTYITGTLTETLTIPDGQEITLANVSINTSSGPGINCQGSATINLVGTNSVTADEDGMPGIYSGPSGSTLTIRGDGSLTAVSTNDGAGIGSGIQLTSYDNCGNIIISGGTISATGAYGGAGIGCGYNAKCGNISISGGVVSAKGNMSASIGSSHGNASVCGDISISGGTVTASKSGSEGAGIGCGPLGRCGDITISGGTVISTGSSGAGIGCANTSSVCGRILINGGSVTAKGTGGAAGIGGGVNNDKFTSIEITSGITKVVATTATPDYAEVIGKGYNDNGSGTVTIDGVENPSAGTSLTHLYWNISTITNTNDTWTLTPKS